jgi:electron transport complex protein RnfC
MPAILIESDGQDKPQVTNYVETHCNASLLTPEQIRKIVFDSGVVGLGGAAFPTHIKLNPAKPIETFILNGAECEPYLTCDYRLMLEKTSEILKGLELVVKCLNPKNVYIAIEDNKPEAIRKFKIKNEKLKIDYEVKVLKTQYPQGGEKQLIKTILGKEVPQGKLPYDVGVVVNNIATVFAIYEAVYLGKPLYERVITVTGSALENPKNLLVRVGTPLKDIIEQCQPKIERIGKIVLGGPMMGIAQFSQDTSTIKATSGVILLDKKDVPKFKEEFCIRCGECVKNCPMGLMPCLISMAVEKENWELAKTYGALDCIECGLCSYLCPGKRNIVQAIKLAKLKIKEMGTK